MTIEKKTIIDLNKNKKTVRELTLEEAEQLSKIRGNHQAEQAAQAEAQALRDSANAKLLALGLSPEEVAAITGA